MTANAVSGRTGVFALLGSPVGHSLSPAIHNASFAQLGLDYVYLCHDVEADGIGEAVAGARALGYAGLNVTMPCKAAVVDHLDALSPAAELMGAVNTVECAGGRLVGHNPDGAGLLRPLAEAGRAGAVGGAWACGSAGTHTSFVNRQELEAALRL